MPELLIDILVFALVTSVTLLAERVVGARLSIQRRLGRDVSAPTASGSVLKPNTVTSGFLAWVQTATAPKDPNETTELRRNLALAGFEGPTAPVWYVICRFSLAVGLPVALVIGLTLLGKRLAGMDAIIFPLVFCGVGLLLPHYLVRMLANGRRTAIEHEFPDALDLLVVCVEAGLGLEAAFVRVAREVRESHPRIAREFGWLADEMSAGRSRSDALRALAARVDVESVKAFVALLVQSDSLGVSMAQSLRTYSAEMRETRFLKAEEKAMRIPTLLTLPIVGCFLPVIVVALMLPAGINMARTLIPALHHSSSSSPHGTGARPGSTP
jgi:tight adherence protein C